MNKSIGQHSDETDEFRARYDCKHGYRYTPIHFAYDTHVGLCLFEREYNGYHDSDFYMVVWNAEAGKPESIEFATTRFGCGSAFQSRRDATPEVEAAYAAYKARIDAANVWARLVDDAKRLAVRKDVVVVKGRKVAKGSTGRVFWMGDSAYGTRVGLELTTGEKVFTAATNVEVVIPAGYFPRY
jgi:hypothetical protein